ncbi:hypothetical protein [Thermostaphylospora chromogena]|nr:hypothetical protein [Thermostaphylospora chromogena]
MRSRRQHDAPRPRVSYLEKLAQEERERRIRHTKPSSRDTTR